MHWDSRKDEYYETQEVLLSDVGSKTLGRVAIKEESKNWECTYVGDKGEWHNLGVYRDFGMAKKIVEDRINARAR